MISDELRKEFASGILISDVASYINNHKKEYNQWLNNKDKKKPKPKTPKERSKKNGIYTTK